MALFEKLLRGIVAGHVQSHLLDAYEARGGRYSEEVLPDCGHTPHVEKPEDFQRLLFGFLEEQ